MTNGDKVRQMNNLQLYNWVVTQASGMTHDELLKWLNADNLGKDTTQPREEHPDE